MCSCYNRRVVIAFVASPEEVSAIYPGYNQHVVIAFVVCETQDFASLLIACSVIKGWIMLFHYNGASQ